MHDPLDLRDLVSDELTQRIESGYDVTALRPDVEAAVRDGSEPVLVDLLHQLENSAIRADWTYVEPDDLSGILAVLETPPKPAIAPDDVLDDRIHAAWLGRCVGCTLGKPLEGCTPIQARTYLEQVGAYPLLDFVPAMVPMPPDTLHPSWPSTTRGRVDGMVRDDDLDYTILALHVLETYGRDYTSADVGREWLKRLPFSQVYTAERATYRNLVLRRAPEAAGTDRNPWREWIGAQIRADAYGYVSPGDPLAAAQLAYADASLSHRGNGVYGAMWVAALVAAGFVAGSCREALDLAASVVPPRSRLAAALELVNRLYAEALDWDTARQRIETELGAMSWVHTIPNAALVAAGLLWGQEDFSRTIGLAVQGGWDTDCNGATAGSLFGAVHGMASLPERWTAPLNDRIETGLFGFRALRISQLASRTTVVARRRAS